MPASDLSFTFDTNPFRRAIRTVLGGFDRMAERGQRASRAITQGVSRALLRMGALAASILGVRALLRRLPEVGQAFKIAGDIFFRNFLEPIRRALLPVLQRMLDWVRENRARFLQWGQTVVAVFRTVFGWAQRAFRLVVDFGRTLAQSIRGVLGIQAESFTEFLNVLLAKLAIAVEFILRLAGRILPQLAPIVAQVAALVQSFGQGFIDRFVQLGGIAPQIKTMAQAFQDLIDAIFGGENNLEKAVDLFRTLGEVVASTVITGLNLATAAVSSLVFLVTSLIRALQFIGADAERAEQLRQQQVAAAERFVRTIQRLGASTAEALGFEDIARSIELQTTQPAAGFDVQRTPEEERRGLLGTLGDLFRGLGAGVQIKRTENNFGDINVVPRAGETLGEATGRTLRDELNEDRIGEGD